MCIREKNKLKQGILLDLHGTLVFSNLAWSKAFESFDEKNIFFYNKEIDSKRSRRELAKLAKIDYDELLNRYWNYLEPRYEVIDIILKLNLPVVIVSNSKLEKIKKDLLKVPKIKINKIYSRENGSKPDMKYLDNIIKEQNWSHAYLIGNDFKEDLSKHPNIFSIIFPQPKLTKE